MHLPVRLLSRLMAEVSSFRSWKLVAFSFPRARAISVQLQLPTPGRWRKAVATWDMRKSLERTQYGCVSYQN